MSNTTPTTTDDTSTDTPDARGGDDAPPALVDVTSGDRMTPSFLAHPDVDEGDTVRVTFDNLYDGRYGDEKTVRGTVTTCKADLDDTLACDPATAVVLALTTDDKRVFVTHGRGVYVEKPSQHDARRVGRVTAHANFAGIPRSYPALLATLRDHPDLPDIGPNRTAAIADAYGFDGFISACYIAHVGGDTTRLTAIRRIGETYAPRLAGVVADIYGWDEDEVQRLDPEVDDA